MLFFSPSYIFLVLLPTIAITGWAAWRVRSAYGKWSRVDSGIDRDPLDFARYLLDRQGLNNVRVEAIPGQLTDHYDPRGPVLRVSSTVAGRAGGGPMGSGMESGIGLGRNGFGQPTGFPAPPVRRLSVAQAAVIAHESADETALPHVPLRVQRALWAPLALLGRRRGYRGWYPEYGRQE